jgi:hypothetical protein
VCCVSGKHDGNERLRRRGQKGEQSTSRLPVGRDCERNESMREIAYKVRVCDIIRERERLLLSAQIEDSTSALTAAVFEQLNDPSAILCSITRRTKGHSITAVCSESFRWCKRRMNQSTVPS